MIYQAHAIYGPGQLPVMAGVAAMEECASMAIPWPSTSSFLLISSGIYPAINRSIIFVIIGYAVTQIIWSLLPIFKIREDGLNEPRKKHGRTHPVSHQPMDVR